MRFSVIVPVYNQEDYINKCLDSVLSQALADFEVIAIDDGSTDNSPAVCDCFAEKDGRIRVIHKQNEGPSAARNMGIEMASGDYVLFFDGDDIMARGALAAVDRAASASGEPDIIVCNIASFTDDIASASSLDGLDAFPDCGSSEELAGIIAGLGSAYNTSACRYAIKRELLTRTGHRFVPGIRHEDDLFSTLLICLSECFGVCRDEYYLYRQHPGSRNTAKEIKNKTDILRISAELYKARGGFKSSTNKYSLLDGRAQWLFKRGLLESTAIKDNNIKAVAKAASAALDIEPAAADGLPKLKKLIKLLGEYRGTACFLRLLKLKSKL